MANSASKTEPVPVIIWCVPRSCSTAFERGFLQRKDTRCFHEPMGDPFYFGETRPNRRYSDEECKKSGYWDKTLEGTMRSLLEPSTYDVDVAKGKTECKYIFIKDMALYLFAPDLLRALHPSSKSYPGEASSGDKLSKQLQGLENPTVLPIDLLRRFKHTFLIRTPQKSVPSYYKCVEEKMMGYSYFDPAEVGYAEIKILYDWMSNPESSFNKAPEDELATYPGQIQSQAQPLPLVDASVLLSNPEHTISSYCAAVGMPFDPSMLSWESGPVEEFAKWGAFHAVAENSTGFKKETPICDEAAAAGKRTSTSSASSGSETDTSKPGGSGKRQLSQEVLDTITATMDAYNYLYARRTIHAPAADGKK